jgi:protein SCO1/2
MKRVRIALWVAAALAAATLGFLALTQMDERGGYTQLIPGAFDLPATSGGRVRNTDLRGRPYAIFFGFTRCPEVCPTTMYELSSSLGELGEKGKDFPVFFVTVDPERDDLERLGNYLGSFDAKVTGLRPEPVELPALARQFRVIYEKSPTSDGEYTMNHTASVFLFDGSGRFAGTIGFGEAAAQRTAKLKRLIEGG